MMSDGRCSGTKFYMAKYLSVKTIKMNMKKKIYHEDEIQPLTVGISEKNPGEKKDIDPFMK